MCTPRPAFLCPRLVLVHPFQNAPEIKIKTGFLPCWRVIEDDSLHEFELTGSHCLSGIHDAMNAVEPSIMQLAHRPSIALVLNLDAEMVAPGSPNDLRGNP